MTNSQSVGSPYHDESLDLIYNLLFCDDLSLYRSNHHGPIEGPWKVLFADRKDTASLQAIAMDEGQESRVRLLALNALRGLGTPIETSRLLGVVIEVGLDEGLDTLAAYRDGSARYINHSGKLIIWETREPEIDDLIRELLSASEEVVRKIGPWEGTRLPPPGAGIVRMTFLVSDGLYFGQAPMSVMQNEPTGGPVIASALRLLSALIEKASRHES